MALLVIGLGVVVSCVGSALLLFYVFPNKMLHLIMRSVTSLAFLYLFITFKKAGLCILHTLPPGNVFNLIVFSNKFTVILHFHIYFSGHVTFQLEWKSNMHVLGVRTSNFVMLKKISILLEKHLLYFCMDSLLQKICGLNALR